jgi:flagellar protein FlaG
MSGAVSSTGNVASTQYASVAQSTGAPANTTQVRISAPSGPSDAEIVAKVASTEIKPSNVAEAAQAARVAIERAAEQIQSFVQSMGRDLKFSVDGTTGHHVVVVTNPQTGEVVRQMPSPELLKIAQSLPQFNSGLINQKA